MTTKRMKELDFLRVIGALAVIGIHVTSGYIKSLQIAYVGNQLTRFAVPMFIILSGFALYYSEIGKKDERYFPFLKKRLSKVMIPYILWTIIYMLYSYRHNLSAILESDFYNVLIKNLLKGTTTAHLYFVVIIFQLYLIYPIIKKWMVGKSDKILLGVSFLITLYFQTGIYVRRWDFTIIPTQFMRNYYLLFPTWIFFFVFGMYFAKNHKKWREKLSDKLLIISIVWIMSFILLYWESKWANSFGSSMRPTVTLYAITSLLFFYVIGIKLNKVEGYFDKFIKFFASQSFVVYLSHILIMYRLNVIPSKIGLPGIWEGILGMCLYYITVTIGSLFLGYILDLIPFSSYIGGNRKGMHKNKVPATVQK